uniref:non-specific serine/threonine protein kinase n=1 Tax=Plectus sambesii TaxID=2011161 RepID=A0A914VBR2_9BILA
MTLSMQRRDNSYAALESEYILGEELGSGGFGKVKLATHILTGHKVAVKIIDKVAIGDDLPRVKTEMDALRTLAHQNICRLYHYIETAEKFFIIMEYCSGGEMFDYIVKKERLEESEARHFFRQIVAAIAYVHSMGFAHRDMKPENLLLTEDLQLKLIDFGLCAKPDQGLQNHLETCCGSPAYAAPELIQGTAYRGNEADIWSMGVLLYALLCGALPFEDENIQQLYRKISCFVLSIGKYEEPEWLSSASRSLLRSMLQVEPRRRIKIEDMLIHPWINKKYTQPLKWKTIYDKNIIDEECARELATYHRMSLDDMVTTLKKWKFDYTTATYFLLLQQKRKGRPVILPLLRPDDMIKNRNAALVASPTIHSSLDNGLERSGIDDDNPLDTAFVFNRPFSPTDKHISYARAMHNGAVIMNEVRSERPQMPPGVTPVRTRIRNVDDKENVEPRSQTVKVRGPVKITDESPRPKSVYSTPRNNNHRPTVITTVQAATPESANRNGRSQSSERESGSTPVSPSASGERTPRSATKTPRLRQRVFASLERKADKVFNLLTPRRVRQDAPTVLKRTSNMVNVSVTSSTDPELVRSELVRVFEDKGISCEQIGWKVSGKKKDVAGRTLLMVEMEVVMIDSLDMVGVKRKRLNGDAFLYKRVCEDVLRLAGL